MVRTSWVLAVAGLLSMVPETPSTTPGGQEAPRTGSERLQERRKRDRDLAQAVQPVKMRAGVPRDVAPAMDLTTGVPRFRMPGLDVLVHPDRVDLTGSNTPLGSLSLARISVGSETVVSSSAVEFRVAGAAEVSAPRGAFVERYRAVPNGVEQLFDIPAPLGIPGDLTFAVRVDSTLSGPAAGATADTFTFWNGQKTGFTYGKVVTIDRDGRRVSSSMSYVNGEVRFVVPGAFLADAAYPVTVDPLIGTIIDVSASTDYYGPGPSHDVAYNATTDEYFFLYNDLPAGAGDIFGNIVNPTTGAVGAQINVDNTTTELANASIAWNPSNNRYLAVYANIDLLSPTFEIEVVGRILDAAGAPVGGVVNFNISATAGTINDFEARVACDGTNWLVVWMAIDSAAATPQGNIRGRIVNGSSTNSAPSFAGATFDIQATADNERNPDVAFGAGGNYLVVWRDITANGGLGRIQGKTVTTGAVVGALNSYDAGVALTTYENPSVTANTTANEFLVGWDQYTTGAGDPIVRRVTSAGAPAAAEVNVDSNAVDDAVQVIVQYNAAANQYFVAWQDDAGTNFSSYEIQCAQLNGATAAVVTTNIALAAVSEVGFLTMTMMNSATRTNVAGATHVILSWRHQAPGNPATPPFNVQGQRYDMNNPPSAPVVANMIQKQGAAATAPTDAEGITYVTLPRQESFSGGASTDPEGQQIRLEIERILDSASFTGTFTEQSGLVASGGSPTITVNAIPNGAYKWRARFVDAIGTASAWVDFATATTPDHTFNVPNQLPATPDVTQNATTGQFRMNGTTQIATGATTPEGTVILKGSIAADPDGDNVRLEVEVQPIGTGFTGTPTATSTFGAAGVHQVSFTPVTSAAGYHWQARVRDSSGAVNDTTAWVSYGGNPEANIDFARDAAANTTAAPGALLQFEADGTTALATGATAASRTVVMKATTTDPEGDQYTLEVEVKPIGVAFDNTVTASSPSTNSGAQATVTVTIAGFAPESYHWQVRTRDALGATSAFVVFVGAAGDVPPAGVDFALPQVDFGGSRNNLKCSLAAGAVAAPLAIRGTTLMCGGWWLLALLALGFLRRRR